MKPLIAGNCKMHGHQAWTVKPAAFESLCPAETREHLDVLICPPFPFIRETTKAIFENSFQILSYPFLILPF